MVELTKAHNELFRRKPDEVFASMDDLYQHCCEQREASHDCWQLPQNLFPHLADDRMCLTLDGEGGVGLNDWSFSQLCRLSGVNRDTVNRLSAKTAATVIEETLPSAKKPIQLLSAGDTVRSLHGVAYTRLWNADLLEVVRESADGVAPEDEDHDETIYQAIFKTRRGLPYRALFVVRDDIVFVIHVRGCGQDRLDPDEVQFP